MKTNNTEIEEQIKEIEIYLHRLVASVVDYPDGDNFEQVQYEQQQIDVATKELTNLLTQQRELAVREYTKWLIEHWYCDSDIIDEGGLEQYLSQQREKGKE